MVTSDLTKRHRHWRALLWLGLFVLFLYVGLSMMIRNFAPLLALVRLLVGWTAIVRINVLQLSTSPARLVMAVGIAMAALIGLHLLALTWRKRVWPDLPRWRLRWSGALFAGLLSCSIAAIAFAGAAHQIAWLKGEPFTISSRFRDKNFLAVLDLAKQLEEQAFREGVDGKYPDSLNEVRWERGSMSNLFPDRLLLYQASETATPEPWIYHGKGLNANSPDGLLLLSAPRSVNGQRWVVLTSIEAKQVSDAKYQALVSQRHAKAQGGRPKTE